MVKWKWENNMEDVIKSRPELYTGLSSLDMELAAVDRKPESWSRQQRLNRVGTDSEILLRTSLTYPLSGLFTLVEAHRDYPESCKKLALFLKTQCGQIPLEDLLKQVFTARFPRVWMERFIFILLEVQSSDWQTSAYVLQFRSLKRLLLRVERHKPLNPGETALARDIIHVLGLSRFMDVERFCIHASNIFRQMQSKRIPQTNDLGLLVYLIRCEASCMAERRNWLESDLDSGDPESVARMTPLLQLLENRTKNARDLANRIANIGPIHDGPMSLEEHLGPFFFRHFKEAIDRVPELATLKKTLELQEFKRVPTPDLIALTSLCRWLIEARGLSLSPLEWIRTALESYDRGHFRLDVVGGLPAVEALLSEVKVERDETIVLGNFAENAYPSWISREGLSRPFQSSNPNRISPDLQSIVLANIHRDNIILRLLENAKVYLKPGLIESIVAGSLSPRVHEAIATRRELHSGAVNHRVPLALLKSQVKIPSALVKNLINPSVMPFTDIKSLYRSRDTLRPDVAEELHTFFTQAYAL